MLKKLLKPTIQNKMLIAILPLLFIQVVIVGSLTLFFAIQEFNTSINQYINQRKNDAIYLSEKSEILDYLQNIHYDLEDEAILYQQRLEELYKGFINRTKLKNDRIYKKISFINKNGKEIAKIDSESKYAKNTYQNLSDNDIFNKTKTIEPNKPAIEIISKDEMLVYTPLYLDLDGDGIVEYNGAIITKAIYPADEFKKAAILSLSLTFVLVLIGAAIIFTTITVVKKLIEPIHALVGVTNELSAGNLDAKATITSHDELGQLSESFNRMAEELKHNINELEEYKNELEVKVAQRTEELEKSNTDLSEAYKKLKSTQAQLVHSEKMASLGQLVAGVAHELNNPINFIYGNMPHLKNYINDFKLLLGKYEDSKIDTEKISDINKLKEDINWDFLLPDLDLLIKDCYNGAQRAKDIIQDLKKFSRIGEAEFKYSDLHEGLDSTLNLLINSLKNKIEVEKEYGKLEKIECYPDQLNQVFMNLLSNAIQAMPKEKIDSKEAKIWITTKQIDRRVIITIKDNAKGIKEESLKNIFDPFFTTKPVGEGTGLGLSITYGIIEKHHGKIEVESKIGEGTMFTIELPIHQKDYSPQKAY
ncbi:MAG: ATP-binding protein [Cyanobacteriota bacterium]